MAIYLITDFFPLGDSIKDNLRKSGTELLRVSLSLITSSSPYRKEILNQISRLCVEIVSLSKVASNVGMTSIPNHNVLESEVKNFISVIEDRDRPSTTGQGFVLNDEVLGFKTNLNSSISTTMSTPATSSVPGKIFTSEKVSTDKKTKEEVVIENTIIAPTSSDLRSASYAGVKTKVMENTEVGELQNITVAVETVGVAKSVMQKNERQQLILGIIREIGESSIKDISDNIKDCSEKTIQRELNTLIYDGVLKKIGERRWSKYILA
jgi:predicted HTH transcriptional regulator